MNEIIFDVDHMIHKFTDLNQNSKEESIMVDDNQHKTLNDFAEATTVFNENST